MTRQVCIVHEGEVDSNRYLLALGFVINCTSLKTNSFAKRQDNSFKIFKRGRERNVYESKGETTRYKKSR